MTLADVLSTAPSLFYPQTWYRGEAFLETDVPLIAALPKLTKPGYTPIPGNPTLPSVAELVAAYLVDPTSPVWAFFVWTRDVDRHGNAIYVGGVGHDDVLGLQIHRHLRITDRWRVPA